MKKIKVNESACIACGACVAIDGEHFEFNDKGLSTVISQDNLESQLVTNAIEACPTGAIFMEESGCDCANGGECCCDECECDDCECDECDCGECCDCQEHHQCEE